MKKAVIEQMFLGFLALTTIVVFVSTVNDEIQARNKTHYLHDLANESIKTMSIIYKKAIDAGAASEMTAICAAQTAATALLNNSDLGSELVSTNNINFVWRDGGTYDSNGNLISATPDGRPDSVSSTIGTYTQNAFWYRFFNRTDFTLPGFTRSVDLTAANYDTTVYFRDVINAGYYNMVGTYELDANGCATNPQLILDNKNSFVKGDILTEIRWPDRKIFFISDGYRRFGNFSGGNNASIDLTTQIELEHDCVNSPGSIPVVKITTNSGQVQRNTDNTNPTFNYLPQRANVYFEDSSLNYDNAYDHMNEIAESQYGKFIAYIEDTGHYTTEAWAYYNSLSRSQKRVVGQAHTYEEWVTYAQSKNIDYSVDPDDNFVFVSEDLSTINGDDPWNSDRDFTDMSINLKKVFIPTAIDSSLISSDAIMNITCP